MDKTTMSKKRSGFELKSGKGRGSYLFIIEDKDAFENDDIRAIHLLRLALHSTSRREVMIA